MKITDDDIKKAEQIFLPEGFSFDDKRTAFNKCIDQSLHVQACPGSGKTTALLAKLYILSEKMPFEGNKGICVLTHTNVAIDIIKQKLGEKASKLFTYPNFFGTIQSFVDKYLAIPAYIKCFGYRPNVIDDDLFYDRIKKNSMMINKNIWLKYNKGIYETPVDFVADIDIQFYEVKNIRFEIKHDRLQNRDSETYRLLEDIYKELFKNGYLRYKDAYSLGKLYLDKFPEPNKIFSSRFKFVFIDEAQDTSKIQIEIIEKCFNENVVIQWLGDVNQGIMNNDYTEPAWQPKENERYKKISFTKSHRVSQPIANIIKNVAKNKYDKLDGNTGIDLKPIILLFDDNSKGYVLEKFSEIIVNKKCTYNGEEKNILEVSELSGNPIKAVGWIGKEKQNGLSIKSYYSEFDKKNTNKRKIYFPNLYTMCKLSQNIAPKEFKNRTISCIIEALNLSEIKSMKNKPYSKTELINEIKEKNEKALHELLTVISSYIKENNFEVFSKKILDILEKIYAVSDSSNDYLIKEEWKEVSFANQNLREFNVYENNGVKIFIDTVHGVKGETHTATLYLETKYYQNSIKFFKDEFLALTENHQSENSDRKKKALNIAHVAFSRPTHLLCIAINKSDIDINRFNVNNFEVFDLTLNIK